MDYNLVNNNDAHLEYKSTKIKNFPIFLTLIILIVLCIVNTISIVLFIIKKRDAETLNEIKLNKIKKEYDSYLSETILTRELVELYKTSNLKIIPIKNFEELLDVRDNLKKPILFNERIKEKVQYFILYLIILSIYI